MKILFVGFNRTYMNRTFNLQLRGLKTRFDVTCYGPGFMPSTVLEGGIASWSDKNGPWDLIVFDSYIAQFFEVAARAKPFLCDYLQFDQREFYAFGPGMVDFVLNSGLPSMLVANFDAYCASQDWTEMIEKAGWYIADGYLCAITLAEKIDRAYVRGDGDSLPNMTGGHGTDSWLNLMRAIPERVVSTPHVVGLDQINMTPIIERSEHFSVPGAKYAERAALYDLQSKQLRRRKAMDRVRDWIYFRSGSSMTRAQMADLWSRYDLEIEQSKMTFVSGSFFMNPLRKYFEVPALGSVPIGHVCEGFIELGFVDKENFIIAENRQQVEEALSGYSDTDLQCIATAAQSLFFAKHTAVARSDQLAESITRIKAGTFKGSYWDKGEYCHAV